MALHGKFILNDADYSPSPSLGLEHFWPFPAAEFTAIVGHVLMF